jgi:hypothetical protein
MIEREILIMNTKDQGKYRVVTDASTLDELKGILQRNEGVYKKVGASWVQNDRPIALNGVGFTEGITKAEYRDGSALIPETVPFKGGMASPVFLLTNTQKQISSGAAPKYDRKELYARIKSYGLEETVKTKFGKNFTMVSSADLAALISKVVVGENNEQLNAVREEVANIGKEEKEENNLPEVKTAPHAATVDWFYDGIKNMIGENLLWPEDVVVLADLTKELAQRLMEAKPKITDEDLENMVYSIR